MKKLLYILAFLPFPLLADYDSLYCIAVDQYFASREAVVNNDVIGVWLQNWTYLGSDATVSIQTNWNSAFGFHGDSIYIVDATKINGKIVQQDTIIKILIKSIADGTTEYDTAFIRVKEDSYCHFDDDFETPEAGHGYFYSRGSIHTNLYWDTLSVVSTSTNPLIIGAYGRGDRPIITGEDGSGSILWIGDRTGENNEDYRSEYVYIYDLEMTDCGEEAFHINRTSTDIQIHNCWFHNVNQDDVQAMVDFNTQWYGDSIETYYFRIQNCRFDTSGINCEADCDNTGLKIGAGETETINCYFGYMGMDATAYRPCGGRLHKGKHIYFAGETTNFYPMQVRCDSSLFQDIVFENYIGGSGVNSNLIGINSAGGETGMNADSIVFDNIYFKNNSTDQAVIIRRDGTNFSPSDDIYFRNILSKNNTFSVAVFYIKEGRTIYIEQSKFLDEAVKILGEDDGEIEDLHINYCVAYNAPDEEFTLDGDEVYVYNNIVDGEINNTLCTHDTTRYCYLVTLTGDLFVEDTLHADFHSDDFTNYATHDYTLVLGADGIDAGGDWGQAQDIIGNTKSGAEWDIGAYEYQQAESGTANTYLDGKLGVKTYKGKTVTFLKP